MYQDLTKLITYKLADNFDCSGWGRRRFCAHVRRFHFCQAPPRTWPLTMKDIYLCLVDASQELVSQRNVPPPPQQTVVLPPGYGYASNALQVTHADPTILPAQQSAQPK